jgi:diguanylate cyclase (GGDEF)-like protein/PAS domain S-box-containing protein
MKNLIRSFLLGGLLGGLMMMGAPSVSAAPTQKTVLVLSPFQVDLSTNLIALQAIREEFGKAADLSLDVYYENLDLNRFPDPANQQKIFDLLTTKYKNKPVDLVIVGSEGMLKLWLAQRAKILPNTPIVFFDISTEHLGALDLPANVTGVSGVEDCEKSARWALGAMPAVNEIVLVVGVGEIEQGFFDHIEKLQEDMKGQVKFTNLSNLPLAEIKQRVAKLPESSIVLYHPMFVDADGNKHRPNDVLQELTAVSSVPIVGGYDVFIGTGIVGGYMYSIDQQARDAAQISLQVLRGKEISAIPFAQNESNRFIFNHLALQRFGIPLSALPPDSIIKNRQYSMWELYKVQIFSTSVIIAILLTLVMVLISVTRRLNIARLELSRLNTNLENQVQERTAALSQANHDLHLEITERKQVEADLQESEARFRSYFELPLTGRAITSPDKGWIDVNATLCEMLAFTRDELMQMTWSELTHPDDLAADLAQFNRILAEEINGYDMEKRFLRKDGHVIHTHLAVQCLRRPDRSVDYIVALIQDITERKQYEAALRNSELFINGVLNSLTAQIAVLDERGVIVIVNAAWRKFAASNNCPEPACYVGTNYLTICESAVRAGDQSAEAILRGMQAVLAGSQDQFIDEYPCNAPNIPRWFTMTVLPQNHPHKGLIVVHQEITERKLAEKAMRESERRTATILRLSPIVIGVSTVAEGRYTDVNDAFESVLGYSQAETIGRTSFDLNLWTDGDTRSNILREIVEHGRVENLEVQLRRKSGEIFPALIFITPIVLHDTPCLLSMIMDITERKLVEEQLRETRDALQTIFYSSPLAILTLDTEDRVAMWNPAAEEIFGWTEKEVIEQVNPTVPDNKLNEYNALCQATLNGMAFSNLDTLRMKKDGTQFPVNLSVAPLRGKQSQVTGGVHVIADNTERKKLQEELRQQATTDGLTGILNRRHFQQLALSDLKRAIRFNHPLAIVLIDIDHFKQVNDTFGHAAGDQALLAFTKICQQNIREIDLFARFGGDEFVLLLPETDCGQAYAVVERLRVAVTAASINFDGKQIPITISSGITSLSGDQESFDTLLGQADQALYHAKEEGRNNVVRYDNLCD